MYLEPSKHKAQLLVKQYYPCDSRNVEKGWTQLVPNHFSWTVLCVMQNLLQFSLETPGFKPCGHLSSELSERAWNDHNPTFCIHYKMWRWKKKSWVGVTNWCQCVAEDSRIPKMPDINPLQALVHPLLKKLSCMGYASPTPNSQNLPFFGK